MEDTMKVIILAAGQGTRLRPLTDECPKCMVKINGKSIIERQLETMYSCGIKGEDITMIAGYRNDVLQNYLRNTGIHFIVNNEFETTNMVYSLMCARNIMESETDILISYGDIIYNKDVLGKILASTADSSVVVDDDWYEYWSARYESPLDDAETLMFDMEDCLTEIGQKTTELTKVQSQYIGLIRFKAEGLKAMLALSAEAQRRSDGSERLWRTSRDYSKMYMTDLLQGMIDEGKKLKTVHIHRGWYEIDNPEDLKIVESHLEE